MSQPEVRPCGDDLVLSLRDITKTYNTGELAVPVLKGISFDIYRGQFVGILGTSGSGKSTMLNILGMLDVPTGGEYTLEGIPVDLPIPHQRHLARRYRQNLWILFDGKAL